MIIDFRILRLTEFMRNASKTTTEVLENLITKNYTYFEKLTSDLKIKVDLLEKAWESFFNASDKARIERD